MTATGQMRDKPSCVGLPMSKPPQFLVGRNRCGQWVVCDWNGRCGGLFNSREEALRFAFRERGEAPGAVVLVPDVLELFETPSNGAAKSVGDPNDVRAAGRRIALEA